MPIPKPNMNESKEDFLDRCMIDATMVAEYDDKQRYAICESQLETNKKIMDVKNINERHIKKVVEDENSISIIFGKSEDWEGIEINKEDNSESLENEQEEEALRGPDDLEEDPTEDILEEIDEEEEEEIEEDPALEYANRSTQKVDVWDKKHTQETRFLNIESR